MEEEHEQQERGFDSDEQAEIIRKRSRGIDIDKSVNDAMRSILFHHSRGLQPFKLSDMGPKIMKRSRVPAVVIQSVLKRVKERFLEDFGFELVELPPAPGKIKSSRSTTYYILRNKMIELIDEFDIDDEKKRDHIISAVEEEKNRDRIIAAEEKEIEILNLLSPSMLAPHGFLLLILSIISLNHEKCDDQRFWKSLYKLGFEKDMYHSTLGNIDLLIKTFIKQQYIIYSKVSNNEMAHDISEVNWIWTFGPRAFIEISHLELAEFIVQACGKELNPIERNHAKQLDILHHSEHDIFTSQ